MIKKSTYPISWPVLAGLIGGCLVLAYFFLPSDRLLLERQIRDGFTESALKTLRQLPAGERQKDPAYFALTELRLLRKSLKSDEEADRQFLRACQAFEKYGFREEFAEEISARIPWITQLPSAYELVAKLLPRMSIANQLSISKAFAERALAAGNAALAAQVYTRSWELMPLSEAATQQLADYWRYANLAGNALAAVDKHIQRAGTNAISFALARRRIDLLLEIGQARNAFQATSNLFHRAGPEQRRELFPFLLETARQSEQLLSILPVAREMAENNPQDPKAWKTLAELAGAAGDQALAAKAMRQWDAVEPLEGERLLKLAQIYQWTNKPKEAFDEYLRALKAKRPEAVRPLLALNPGLYRDEELAAALAQAPEVVAQTDAGLEVARLFAVTADFDAARNMYERLLSRQPSDFATLYEFGRLLIDLEEYDKALTIFHRAERLQPKHEAVQRSLAEIQFRLGNFTGALDRYKQLAMINPAGTALENSLTLAESMGRILDAIEVLTRKLSTTNQLSRDYLRLAHYHNMLGNLGRAREVLEQGLARFPRDNGLRKELASSFSNARQYAAAADALSTHAALRTNPELAYFYLKLLVAAGRYDAATEFIKGLNAEWLDQPLMLELLAAVHENTRNWKKAAEVYRKLHQLQPANDQFFASLVHSLSRDGRLSEAEALIRPQLARPDVPPAFLKLAAEAYHAAGNFALATQYQERYLKTNPADLALAQGFLGDLYRAQKDRPNAQKAHERALFEMLREISTQAKN